MSEKVRRLRDRVRFYERRAAIARGQLKALERRIAPLPTPDEEPPRVFYRPPETFPGLALVSLSELTECDRGYIERAISAHAEEAQAQPRRPPRPQLNPRSKGLAKRRLRALLSMGERSILREGFVSGFEWARALSGCSPDDFDIELFDALDLLS